MVHGVHGVNVVIVLCMCLLPVFCQLLLENIRWSRPWVHNEEGQAPRPPGSAPPIPLLKHILPKRCFAILESRMYPMVGPPVQTPNPPSRASSYHIGPDPCAGAKGTTFFSLRVEPLAPLPIQFWDPLWQKRTMLFAKQVFTHIDVEVSQSNQCAPPPPQNSPLKFVAMTIYLCHGSICEPSIRCSWPKQPTTPPPASGYHSPVGVQHCNRRSPMMYPGLYH